MAGIENNGFIDPASYYFGYSTFLA